MKKSGAKIGLILAFICLIFTGLLKWHKSVLLDELPEYKRSVLEVMRQTLEDRHITVVRTKSSVDFCATSLRASLNNWNGAKAGYRFFMYLISEKLGLKKRLVGFGFFYDEPHLVEGLWSSPKNGAAYTNQWEDYRCKGQDTKKYVQLHFFETFLHD